MLKKLTVSQQQKKDAEKLKLLIVDNISTA